MSELLPRPLRLMLGATSRGVGDRRLRNAVQEKVVLITGASSGVGEATALRLGRAGATVLLVARREERLEEVRDRVSEAGGEAYIYPCDLSDVDAVGALAEEVLGSTDDCGCAELQAVTGTVAAVINTVAPLAHLL